MSHKDYISGCDEDQLNRLIEMAKARVKEISESGWVKLWVVSIGWGNVAWFREDKHAAAVEYACAATRADAMQHPGKPVEMEVSLARYRPEEVARLLATAPVVEKEKT